MAAPEILLVEDHLETRRALSAILSRTGFDVIEAGTVAEGLAKVASQAFALLDLNLPDGEGTIICNRIRAQAPQTRVAFVTASYDPESTLRIKGVCFDAVFRKPIDVGALIQWLQTSP